MDNIIIQRISEGDSGARAAAKIYSNDKVLKDAVTDVKDTLNAYGNLINVTVPMSGDTAVVELVQEPGSKTAAVMSQKAVTDFVIDETEDACQVGEVIETGIEMPSNRTYTDAWVSRASANAQGNSLTELYDDVQELKKLYQELKNKVVFLGDIVNW